jgi:hypothetical protein
MTIVTCDYRPKRARKAKRIVEFPCGRIVTVSAKPKQQHYYDMKGAPDDATRRKLVDAFLARVMKQR